MLRKVGVTVIPTLLLLWKPIEALLNWIGLIDTAQGVMSPDHWVHKVVFWPHLGNLMTAIGVVLLALIFGRRKQLFGGPVVQVNHFSSTAAIGGRLLASRVIRLRNSGSPFDLVARVAIIATADGYEGTGGDEFAVRLVKGTDGVSDFTIAVLDEVKKQEGSLVPVVKAIGEGLHPYKFWEVRRGFWVDFQWQFFHDKNYELQLVKTQIVRVSF